jgi:hypothetical protein
VAVTTFFFAVVAVDVVVAAQALTLGRASAMAPRTAATVLRTKWLLGRFR